MPSPRLVMHGAAAGARMAEPLPDDAVLQRSEKARRAHPEWESGGGGLVSTITDYARFAEMLRNGGKLDGKQYLSPAAVTQMTSDHVGPRFRVTRDYFHFPGDGFGHGSGLS